MSAAGFVQRLRARERCLFGTWVKLPTHETLEMLARAGFDYVVLDAEHAPLTLETIYRLIAHAQALGLGALVRVPDQASNDFQRLLDCGADGLLVPRVRNADEARRAIGRMVFSPAGERGLGITSRAGAWGTEPLADYLRRGAEDVLRCPQFEDRQVLEHPGAVLDVSGVNAAFIGMGDLSMTTACRRPIPNCRRWPTDCWQPAGSGTCPAVRPPATPRRPCGRPSAASPSSW